MSVGSMIQRLRAAGLIGRRELPTVDWPRAYPGPWPIRAHRTVAEVDALAHCPECDLWLGADESCPHIPALPFTRGSAGATAEGAHP